VTSQEVVTQRHLTGIHVALTDASWYAKYVFPFFNAQRRVPFVVFDVLGTPPRVWDRDVTFEGRELRVNAAAKDVPLVTLPGAKRFEGVQHFDPWWAFKGAGLPPDLVRAIVPTNIAGRLYPLDVPRSVVDVAFDRSLRILVAVDMEDDHLARKTFFEGTLDLAKLRLRSAQPLGMSRRNAPRSSNDVPSKRE
jgi:hypothetical protein